MADTPKHSVSVAGIVVDDRNRVLVIQRRDNGHWEPPGGVLELDETPEAGAVREVHEETGLCVEVQALSGVYKNMKKGVVALVFRCREKGGAVRLTDEARQVAWKTVEQLEKSMTQAYLVRVTDALSLSVHVRSHDGAILLDPESASEATV